MDLRYRILNVFGIPGQRLSGNPLCVFEDGRELTDAQMRALARQFNLSETTFILPTTREDADARVRIFTPSFEMPFAGHPTLGTAHVVRSLLSNKSRILLEMKAGLVDVASRGDRWTLRTARAPEARKPTATREELAAMLGLPIDSVLDGPLWVDTGAEQLVLPLRTPDDVRKARPNATLLGQHGFSEKRGAAMAYVWAPEDEASIVARFFFLVNGGVVEDPATGSACANLGGWFITKNRTLPFTARVTQGEAIERPSLLDLRVNEEGRIFVGGDVIELGAGTLRL